MTRIMECRIRPDRLAADTRGGCNPKEILLGFSFPQDVSLVNRQYEGGALRPNKERGNLPTRSGRKLSLSWKSSLNRQKGGNSRDIKLNWCTAR